MRIFTAFLPGLLFVFCTNGKESTYTGSTPANTVVRSFLGIPLPDSVDFIRWKLVLRDNQYHLQCNYGISKPNTNGFINGGRKIELSGELSKEKNYCYLQNGNKTLKIVELNDDLLQLLDTDNNMLAGNGGWSYTLNSLTPSISSKVNVSARQTALKDSMSFEGRTPCDVPGVVAPGKECYKLKWHIVLYANAQKNEPGKYRIPGSPWYREGGRTGTWKIITGKEGHIIYQLKDDKEDMFLYLLKLDEHVLMFTNAEGKLLVGNEDFSYTMNRRW